MIEIKMKQLTKFPPTISAPTAEELLQSLPWLSKDASKIHFFKVELQNVMEKWNSFI